MPIMLSKHEEERALSALLAQIETPAGAGAAPKAEGGWHDRH
jgi:hypothetical protein